MLIPCRSLSGVPGSTCTNWVLRCTDPVLLVVQLFDRVLTLAVPHVKEDLTMKQGHDDRQGAAVRTSDLRGERLASRTPVIRRLMRVALSGLVSLYACAEDGAPAALSSPVVSASDRGADATVTIPETPDVPLLESQLVDGVREFHVRAHAFQQQLATFPRRSAEVWGYNGSTPGPTAIAFEGERIRFVVTNHLPEPTTVHFHGMHAPNEYDGVAGVSQVQPIAPGQAFVYEFTPGHSGSFAYHAHRDGAKQELKGLDGFFAVLPQRQRASERVDRDFVMVLQQFFFEEEGQPVEPFPPGGEFNTFTINGKTQDAATPLVVKVGERVRVRFYNASQNLHSMHLHGFDMRIVSQNGHRRQREGQFEVTTVDVGPGNFFDVEFVADKPGKWTLHCHFPHHTSNAMMSGPNGSPVGMTRVIEAVQ